jgi:hypothetical protein
MTKGEGRRMGMFKQFQYLISGQWHKIGRLIDTKQCRREQIRQVRKEARAFAERARATAEAKR